MVWLRTISLAALVGVICPLAAAETLLVEFTSPDCGPCQQMRPVIQQLMAEGYQVREVNVASDRDTAHRFGVDSMPTFLVLVDGKEQARLVGGGQTKVDLVALIERGAAKAAPHTNATANASAVEFVGVNGRDGAGTFAPPEQGRVVPLQPPAPTMSPAASRERPSAGSAHLINSTVRLSIEDPDGRSTGTGTIVDARTGKALVLTCGHLFRSSGGKGAIEISLFAAGPNGAELRSKIEGQLIDFDLERDLALVCFVTDSAVAVSPVAPAGTSLQAGAMATSVGCEHGANPTPWSTRITQVDRYQGHPNVECSGAPVEGRSGGGLFNEAGQLIGVCNFADPEGEEGIYRSLPSIHAKLDALNLALVYQQPSLGTPPTTASDAAIQMAQSNQPAPIEFRGQNPTQSPQSSTSGGSEGVRNPFAAVSTSQESVAVAEPQPTAQALAAPTPVASPAMAATAPAPAAVPVDLSNLSAEERATLQEIGRRAGGGELICIIAPQSPGGRSEVIKLNTASPAFIRALTAAAQSAPAVPAVATAPAGGILR